MVGVVTWLAAVAFALMGLGALAAPERVTGLFGLDSLPGAMRNEVRAVYGGFGLAVALVLALTRWVPALQPGVLVTVGAALVGMAVGRAISGVVERSLPKTPALFLVLELAVGLALLAAWSSLG